MNGRLDTDGHFQEANSTTGENKIKLTLDYLTFRPEPPICEISKHERWLVENAASRCAIDRCEREANRQHDIYLKEQAVKICDRLISRATVGENALTPTSDIFWKAYWGVVKEQAEALKAEYQGKKDEDDLP